MSAAALIKCYCGINELRCKYLQKKKTKIIEGVTTGHIRITAVSSIIFRIDFMFSKQSISDFYFLFSPSPSPSRSCVGLLDEKPGFNSHARH